MLCLVIIVGAVTHSLAAQINQMLESMLESCTQSLPPLLEKICTYITTSQVKTLLFEPIKDQVFESLKQFEQTIDTHYTPEEKQQIRMDLIEAIRDVVCTSLKR